MRILYVFNVDTDEYSGVLTKINNQIETWTNMGHEVHVLSYPVAKGHNRRSMLTPQVVSHAIANSNWAYKNLNNGFYNILNKTLSSQKVKSLLRTLQPDIIYMREMIGFPGIDVFKPYKVVLEANTLLKDEIVANSQRIKLFFSIFQKKLYRLVSGFVGVTHEITQSFTVLSKPSVTITNGRKLSDINLTYRPVSKRAQLIFVGAENFRWNGTDKIYLMANALPEFDFHIIGTGHADALQPENVKVYDYLNQGKLKDLYQSMDIAIGTLALHRKNMQEACPLKVREYALYGLPMIIAYEDTDFSGQDFVLQLENSENNIVPYIDKISAFIQLWQGKRIERQLIEKLISIEVKEHTRLKFFEQISKN